jgi:hypothetical protein
MTEMPPSTSIVLVGVMPALRDLEIAKLLGWYRIPLRRAPKVINVEYIAFYQTGAFGSDYRWQIGSFAAVRGHELTTRAELFKDQADHPRAREEYYKLQLGPLQILPRPIRAGAWKRITFFYTTGELFSRAETIKDLVVRSEERQLLWRSLRERALLSGEYHAQDLPDLPDDPMLYALLGLFEG